MQDCCFACRATPCHQASSQNFKYVLGRSCCKSTLTKSRGRGGVVVKLLASRLNEPVSIPSGVAREFSHAGIVPDYSADRPPGKGGSWDAISLTGLKQASRRPATVKLKWFRQWPSGHWGFGDCVCFERLRTSMLFKNTYLFVISVHLRLRFFLHYMCVRSYPVERSKIKWHVLRADEGESLWIWIGVKIQGRGKQEIPEKTCVPVASSGKITTCENSGATQPGIELGGVLQKRPRVDDMCPQHVLARAFHNFWCRLHTCLEVNGGHFQHLL
ncbi:hypothetical protein PR048_010382 [Dryococelus australis]|uniref:Uncharacterized protein n=1 Tax=Dryococelus australis TaxID=614101 RepID=A0ABQ9I4J3_9NEOP|nr:hypothetical protein PR048_010382 [Dryococelus australis]